MKGFCEILGLDPLYLANEGKIVVRRAGGRGRRALAAHARHIRSGAAARDHRRRDRASAPGRVVMQTVFGGRRIVDMLVGEQLPRIC